MIFTTTKNILFITLIFISNLAISSEFKTSINLGKFSIIDLNNILKITTKIKDSKNKIKFISEKFKGIRYKRHTLSSPNLPETFIINFAALDCFTYLDYIEALRRSISFSDFLINLKLVRYQEGQVNYFTRNHFFTTWQFENKSEIEDVTSKVGANKTSVVIKFLNQKKNGNLYLPKITITKIERTFIPSNLIDKEIISKLENGDYIGIYSPKMGLDISHVGILIKQDEQVLFRHASLLNKKVIDSDFLKYISTKAGIVIFRVRL